MYDVIIIKFVNERTGEWIMIRCFWGKKASNICNGLSTKLSGDIIVQKFFVVKQNDNIRAGWYT